MKNTSNFNNYTNTNTKIQVQNNNINDNGSVSKEWKKSSINMMNR